MADLLQDELSGFSSVASGGQQRARWRTVNGWVRAQRTSEFTLKLAGPSNALMRILSANSDKWRCVGSDAGRTPLHFADSGAAEMVLVSAARLGARVSWR